MLKIQVRRLAKRGQLLAGSAAGMSAYAEQEAGRQWQWIVRRLLQEKETLFEFDWPGAGLDLDGDRVPGYPAVDDYEVEEGVAAPLPHRSILLQTKVPCAVGPAARYIWLIDRRDDNGFSAVPCVLHGRGPLSTFGVTIEYLPGHVTEEGAPQPICVQCPDGYPYDVEEFVLQFRLIARFLRILGYRNSDGGSERHVGRRVGGYRTRKERTRQYEIIRIDPALLPRPAGRATGAGKSPSAHFRRAHVRHLRNGQTVRVRDCIVNRDRGTPTPQHFTLE